MKILNKFVNNRAYLLVFVLLALFVFSSVKAVEDLIVVSEKVVSPKKTDIYLDHATILKGYTVSSPDESFKLSLVPGILSQNTRVLIDEIPLEQMNFPWQLERLSPVIMFEFFNKDAYKDHHPFYIQFSYNEANSDYKQVFFYDKGRNMWRPLPTKDFQEEQFVRSLIHLPYAPLAVFSYPDIEVAGKASWYKFKDGNFTASTVYPKGSLLRVYNKENGAFVDVVVNDFGPDRSVFPDRVLDLDYTAFNKISNSGSGIIDVRIEPLYIPKDNFGRVLGVDLGVNDQPYIESSSAILIKESDQSIVYEKNINQKMPVASLTKLLSVSTFLDLGNNNDRLDEIISYQLQDEVYNHQYFNKWQVARINFTNGDLFSIEDGVYSSLVRSANNVVESLVRVSGVSREDFIKEMNDKLLDLELKDSVFVEPTGLDANNISTAYEMAMIAQEAFSKDIVSKASAAPSYRFYTRNDNGLKLRYNSSDLVLQNNNPKFKIIGSKTGYINSDSGYSLVSRAQIGNEVYLAVILNSATRQTSFKEMRELLEFAYSNLNNKQDD